MSTGYEGEWPPRETDLPPRPATGEVRDPQTGSPWQGPASQHATRQTPYGPGYPGGQSPREVSVVPKKKKKAIFLWVFLAVQVIFIIWIAVGVGSGTDEAVNETCAGLSGTELSDCESAAGAGAAVGQGIGIAALVMLWCVVDFLLVVPWVVYRITRRQSTEV